VTATAIPAPADSPAWTGLRAVLCAAVVAGVVLRAVVYRSSLGVLDGDEAVWGLMARHLLDGEFSTFFWGQGYGGTLEVIPTALLFWLFGTSTVAMRLVPIVLTGVAAVLVWRIGRRTVGEPAARIAAVLLWVWPPYLVWKSERAHGFYGSGLVLVCLVLLLAVRLAERRSRVDAALLGLVLGLGWWQTPQIVPIALPALAWLLWRRPGVWRDAWLALGTAALGALPWLVSNLTHGWWSFDVSSGQTPYPERFRGFVSATFPMALGLRVPYTSEWLLGTVLSGLVYLGLVVLFLVAWWRRRRSPAAHLLFGTVAAFPFLYALSPSTWLVDEPRYVVVLLPVLALLIAQGCATAPRAAVAVAASVALSTFVLWHLSSAPAFVERADGLFVPRNFRPLIANLETRGPRRVFAGYWIAYRTDFESRERIVAAEATLKTIALRGGRVVPSRPRKSDENRHQEYDTVVRADPDAGFVFLRATARSLPSSLRTRIGYELETARMRSLLKGAGYERTVVGDFVIYRRGSS
jgi:4-amino-4-deoxy-L-arabinose transferase-like glycosyltransferase